MPVESVPETEISFSAPKKHHFSVEKNGVFGCCPYFLDCLMICLTQQQQLTQDKRSLPSRESSSK